MFVWVFNLRDFSCRTIWYAILATSGLWEVFQVIIISLQWWTCKHFWWFLHFIASQWYPRWLAGVSTFLIIPANYLVNNTCQQGAWEGHPRHFPIIMVVSKRTNFIIFVIFATPWYSRWLESLSTFLIFPDKCLGMLYLPQGGLGRWSKSFFKQNGCVRANHFYDFCIPMVP